MKLLFLYLQDTLYLFQRGPFLTGSQNDRIIFNYSLRDELEPWEFAIEDQGYKGTKTLTPTRLNGPQDQMFSVTQVCHQTINHRFKEYNYLVMIYRHSRREHFYFFAPCALMVQLGIENGEKVFDIFYEEFEGLI